MSIVLGSLMVVLVFDYTLATRVTVEDYSLVDISSSNQQGRILYVKDGESNLPSEFLLRFKAHGKTFSSNLRRAKSIFKRDARVIIDNGHGSYEYQPAPDSMTFEAEDKKTVLTFLEGGEMEGLAVRDNHIYHIHKNTGELPTVEDGNGMESLPCGGTVQKKNENRQGSGTKMTGRRLKGSNKLFPIAQSHDHSIPRMLKVERWSNCFPNDSVTRKLSFGVAIDMNLYKRFMSSTQASQWVAAIVAEANLIYHNQLNVVLTIGDVYIRTTEGGPAWNKDNCALTIHDQIDEMTTWKPPSDQGLWHLFGDCFKGGVIGIATLGSICQSEFNVAVTWRGTETWKIFAHEIGHNFGAEHSFEEGMGTTGGIMDYGDGKLNGEYQFNTKYRKAEVCTVLKRTVDVCKHFTTYDPTLQPTVRPSNQKVTRKPTIVSTIFPTPYPSPGIETKEPGTKQPTHGGIPRTQQPTRGGTINTKRPTRKGKGTKQPHPENPTRGPDTPTNNSTLKCKRFKNRVFWGRPDLKGGAKSGWTVKECHKNCAQTQRCRSYTFGSKKGDCELWSGKKTSQQLSYHPGYNTFMCKTNQTNHPNGTKYPTGRPSKTPEHPTYPPSNSPDESFCTCTGSANFCKYLSGSNLIDICEYFKECKKQCKPSNDDENDDDLNDDDDNYGDDNIDDENEYEYEYETSPPTAPPTFLGCKSIEEKKKCRKSELGCVWRKKSNKCVNAPFELLIGFNSSADIVVDDEDGVDSNKSTTPISSTNKTEISKSHEVVESNNKDNKKLFIFVGSSAAFVLVAIISFVVWRLSRKHTHTPNGTKPFSVV